MRWTGWSNARQFASVITAFHVVEHLPRKRRNLVDGGAESFSPGGILGN